MQYRETKEGVSYTEDRQIGIGECGREVSTATALTFSLKMASRPVVVVIQELLLAIRASWKSGERFSVEICDVTLEKSATSQWRFLSMAGMQRSWNPLCKQCSFS